MALTKNIYNNEAFDHHLGIRELVGRLTFDNSYPTGGEALDLSAYLNGIQQILFEVKNGLWFEYVAATAKVKAYGIDSNVYTAVDLKGCTAVTANSATADQAAAPVNSAAVSAEAAVAAGAYTKGALTDPDVPRSVVVTIKNDSGGPLNLYEGAAVFTVTGLAIDGSTITEDITFTSTAGNKALATAKFRFAHGSKVFKRVTDVVCDHAPADGLKICVGLGPNIGLPNPLAFGLYTDVKAITLSAAEVAPAAANVNTTYSAVIVGTIADNADLMVIYNSKGANEVPNATDLSTLAADVGFTARGY